MHFLRHNLLMLRSGLAGLAVAALVAAPVHSQPYPGNNPTYIPAAVLAPASLTAAGVVAFQTNGVGTLYLRVAGNGASIVGSVDVTESRAASPTWTTIGVQTLGGARVSRITANGLYRVNASGAAQLRFNLASLGSGTVTVSMSAAPGPEFVTTLPSSRATYSATVQAFAPAASATDWLTLTGSATVTVRVTRVSCDGIATAIGAAQLVALKRSTANLTGTSAALTAVPHDSANAAASATGLSYSVNPGTLGTLVGNLRAGTIVLTPAATTTIGTAPLVWDFGTRPGEQEVVLRGIAQVFALNGVAASYPAGTALDCSVTWTEE